MHIAEARGSKCTADLLQRTGLREQSTHVLKQQHSWPAVTRDPDKLVKELSTSIIKEQASTSIGEGLAWEASRKNVVRWHLCGGYAPYIANRLGSSRPLTDVRSSCKSAVLARKEALAANSLKGLPESANAGEELDEGEPHSGL